MVRRFINRIIWAIDPLDTGMALDRGTIDEIGNWSKSKKIQIEPVYLFTPLADHEHSASSKIAGRVARFFSLFNIEMMPPKLIPNPSYSIPSAASALLSHADDVEAGLIVLSSRGRTCLPRALFGSFAGFLVSSAKIPLLFVNRHERPSGSSIRNGLWATMFTPRCQNAFGNFLANSNGICRHLRFFHVMDENGKNGGDKEPSREWQDRALKSGFLADPEVNHAHEHIARHIIRTARNTNSGLIVMTAQANPFFATCLGQLVAQNFPGQRISDLVLWTGFRRAVFGLGYLQRSFGRAGGKSRLGDFA